LDKIEYMLLL